MGQSVSQQLGAGALGYGVDPAYVQQQILQQREKQFAAIQNPQQQLAARLGAMLGGGISNLSQDRGFFDVNDPLLNKVTQIQGIYNQVASQVDPAPNPEQFFTQLQKAYADAGLGQQALMAAQEAQKAKTSGIDVQLKETQLYEKNPELLAGRITAALESGNEAEATRLANLNARLTQDRELKLEKAKTDIAKDKADIAYKLGLAEDGKYKVIWNETLQRYVRTDKKGNVEVVPMNSEMEKLLSGAGNKDTKKGKPEGKLDPNKYMVGGTQPASSAAPAQQTTWSGVPMPAKPTVPLTPMQDRDFALQRAYPTLVISTMDEATKAQLAQQLGL